MQTVTSWFDPKVDGQPVRVGWYQRDWATEYERSIPDYWDGEKWLTGYGGPPAFEESLLQTERKWRGLTESNEEKQ
jgi:hypothetical protein